MHEPTRQEAQRIAVRATAMTDAVEREVEDLARLGVVVLRES